jgi:SulP family sulfate permease
MLIDRLRAIDPLSMLGISSRHLTSDLSVGVVSAIVGIPQGMAYALLAGVNPIYGLYTGIVATAVAGLTTGSQFMNVALTNTVALAVGSALADFSGDVKVEKLFALTLLVGIIQLVFGFARLGDLTRFVSNGVMTGFVAGSAILIIVGQINDLTGYQGTTTGTIAQQIMDAVPALEGNKILQALSMVAHPAHMNLLALLIGVGTIVAIVFLRKTQFKTFSLIIALALASLVANAVNLLATQYSVELVGDVSQIPAGLPSFHLPNLIEGGFGILYSAIAVAVLAMVQGASASQSVPNPDGEYSDPSRDFIGLGAANITGSFFQCMPASGSFSGTALNVSAGARSRMANVFAGIFTGIIVLLFSGLVERISMSALAGVLIVIGFMAIPSGQIRKVWRTNWSARVTMVVTLGATLSIPVQNAIYLGIVLSLVLYIYTSSRQVRVVQIVKTSDGHYEERPVSAALPDRAVTVLNIYGNLYFGAVGTLEKLLPTAKNSRQSVVILRMRGRESLGSTMYRLLERYTAQVQTRGGRLMLVGIDPYLKQELVQTGVINVIGVDNVFEATSVLAQSTEHAVAVAQAWLDQTVKDDEKPS